MILIIRNSFLAKGFSITMIFVMVFTMVVPFNSFALTGGPAQPEFNSFAPIGTSDMVDLTSGDFSYNLPLMDIGGFPINLSYSSGITTDQEASWVGLGWNLSIGQINRQMRGIPDDFKGGNDGDEMTYENNIKENYTVGASLNGRPAFLGKELEFLSFGISTQYNNYNGVSLSPSIGLNFDMAGMVSLGLNVTSSPDGLTIAPSASLHAKLKNKHSSDNLLTGSVGVSFNSRQGLSSLNLSASRKSYLKVKKSNARGATQSKGNIGSSISFVDNHYTPTVQNGLKSNNFTFNAALDAEFFGVEAGSQVRAFGSSQVIAESDKVINLDAYGYDNNHLAREDDIRDFNREKDGNFSINTTNLSLTNLTYDIYSVQGQGVSGMFRPFKSNVGYVSDNKKTTSSTGASLGIETGGGNMFRVGADIEVTSTNTESGVWSDNNNALENMQNPGVPSPEYEEVYYKNVGDLSSDEELDIFGDVDGSLTTANLGEYQPIRISLTKNTKFDVQADNLYQIKHKHAFDSGINNPSGDEFYSNNNTFTSGTFQRHKRVKRNQNILKIRKDEISNNDGDLLGFKVNSHGKDHHTAGFIVTRNDGARYIYGEALYNTSKEEVSFAVGAPKGKIFQFGTPGAIGADCTSGLVEYDHDSDNTDSNEKGDHYYNRVSTPEYAHTYLLTALVSTDYSDNDDVPGLSDRDFGSWTKFTYHNPNPNSDIYQWRVPYNDNPSVGKSHANYNEGLKTDRTDDKGSYVYGTKEVKYIHKIETKTHIAIFHILPRADGVGAGEDGNMDNNSLMYKLDKISLYSKAEYKTAILANEDPTPIKEVHFDYTYELCKGIPNYNGSLDSDLTNQLDSDQLNGKLTLTKVYFTYRNSNMGQYNSYDFIYGDSDHDGTPNAEMNPSYNLKAYNIWGNYQPNNGGCGTMNHPTVPEFNYIQQNDPMSDKYAAAWSMTDIELPSGGVIKIDYESDDYTHVQDQKAMRMFKVVGAGGVYGADFNVNSINNTNFSALDKYPQNLTQEDGEALLFEDDADRTHHKYLFVELDAQDQIAEAPNFGVADFYDKYIKQILEDQKGLMQFRFFVNMTTGGGRNANWTNSPFEYVSGYAKLDDNSSEYKIFEFNNIRYGAIPLKEKTLESGLFYVLDVPLTPVHVNPIAKASWNFGRKYLQKYVFEINDPTDDDDPEKLIRKSLKIGGGLKELLFGPNRLLRDRLVGRRFIPEKSWVRLLEPTKSKKGGGVRVSKIAMTDGWARLNATSSPVVVDDIRDQTYGQEYTYQLENGESSGVATYEPVGSKENPLVQPSYVSEENLGAPIEENYMEMPFGESFFPSPTITYARVVVKNLERKDDNNTSITSDDRIVKKHATGYVVTEHYTSKDYPVILDQTRIDAYEDVSGQLASLLKIKAKKYLTLSQGYVIHLNDMNGKMKSQRVYAEGQDIPISGADYIYDNHTSASLNGYHNKGKLNNTVATLAPNSNAVENKTIGVEYDVINDFREMKSETSIIGVNGNLATFLVGLFPAMVPVPLPDFTRIEDKLNLATTTKVINTFGIQKEVIAYDAGAKVKTKNLLWDSYTGEVLLTETVNEYDDKYYSFNYPAYWHEDYEGMGMASLNSGYETAFSQILSSFQAPQASVDMLEIGDEVLISKFNLFSGKKTAQKQAWIKSKSGSDFMMMDKSGNDIDLSSDLPQTGETFMLKVIRSDKRNLQSTSMGSLVLMENPLNSMSTFLNAVDESYKIVNAGAVRFSDLWTAVCECNIPDPNADPNLDAAPIQNDYVQNTKGVWRAVESMLYLTGRNQDANPTPRNNGFYTQFTPYYKFNTSVSPHSWTDNTSTAIADWTSTSEVTEYSPYGIELENKDALERYSSAQYGYNYMFPMAVSANAKYTQMGFDGFEDYEGFEACPQNEHFGFREQINLATGGAILSTKTAHTGKYSIKLPANSRIVKPMQTICP